MNRCSELPLRLTVELGRKENRRVLQNRVRPTKVLVLAIELLEPHVLVRRDPGASASVDLSSSNPGPKRIGRHAEQLRDGGEGGPLGWLVRAIVQNHPHGSFTQLG